MARPINFLGGTLDADSVVAVEPVTSHTVGSSWEYGFVVKLQGNSITFTTPHPASYGYSGGPTREQYQATAKKARSQFVELIWPGLAAA